MSEVEAFAKVFYRPRAKQTAPDQAGLYRHLNPEVVQRARANEFEDFALAFRPKVEGLMLDRMDRNQEIVTRYLNDGEFRRVVDQELARRTYDQIRAPE